MNSPRVSSIAWTDLLVHHALSYSLNQRLKSGLQLFFDDHKVRFLSTGTFIHVEAAIDFNHDCLYTRVHSVVFARYEGTR